MLTAEQKEQIIDLAQEYEGASKRWKTISELTGIDKEVCRGVVNRAKKADKIENESKPVLPEIPDVDRGIDEIISARIEESKRSKAFYEASEDVEVKIREDKPYGLLFIGDPHMDNSGCDFELLKHHMEILAEVDGLYGISIGDITDNWIGRLKEMYKKTSVNGGEILKLMRWYFDNPGHLAFVMGNHDLWNEGLVLIKQLTEGRNMLVAKDSGIKMKITSDLGGSVKVNCRHNFKGHSQFNPAFGPNKAAFQGDDSDILIQGHRHCFGSTQYFNSNTGKLGHCSIVAGYKVNDSHSKQLGFGKSYQAPSMLYIIDPVDGVVGTGWTDIDKGVDYLNFLRK
jgi:hypothetical protein